LGDGAVKYPTPFSEHFGRRVWRYRRQAYLSQDELGRLLDLHRTEISQIERGLRIPRLDTILKLSAGVEVSPCELTAGLRWRPGSLDQVSGVYGKDAVQARGQMAGSR
jgi:transcriptional regulator with XRE-family HTH domain